MRAFLFLFVLVYIAVLVLYALYDMYRVVRYGKDGDCEFIVTQAIIIFVVGSFILLIKDHL